MFFYIYIYIYIFIEYLYLYISNIKSSVGSTCTPIVSIFNAQTTSSSGLWTALGQIYAYLCS